jgi:hypothetical protein
MNIKNAQELFPTIDHWLSFNELADQREAIHEVLFEKVTQIIRAHFNENPAPGWSVIPWVAPKQDSKWYLDEFGPDSLFLCYRWSYELQLRLDNPMQYDSGAITKALETGNFAELKNAFQRIDRYMQVDSKLMERGNFKFGLPSDGDLSWRELSWCAGFKTDEFAKQAIEKIERFVRNEVVTGQIRELNRIGREAKAGRNQTNS